MIDNNYYSYIGKTVGLMNVLEFIPKVNGGVGGLYRIFCRGCNKEQLVHSYIVRAGNRKSCGCQWNQITHQNVFCRHDLTGRKFGRLIVLKIEENYKPNNPQWICKCSCGNITIVNAQNLRSGNTRSCGCLLRLKGREHRDWAGHGEIYKCYWSSLKNSAKVRNLEFNITIDDIWKKFLGQDRKCALSGIKLKMGKGSEMTASLDRINSDLGYTKENIQWVHKDINSMKWDLSEKEFIKYCILIVNKTNNTLLPSEDYSI